MISCLRPRPIRPIRWHRRDFVPVMDETVMLAHLQINCWCHKHQFPAHLMQRDRRMRWEGERVAVGTAEVMVSLVDDNISFDASTDKLTSDSVNL